MSIQEIEIRSNTPGQIPEKSQPNMQGILRLICDVLVLHFHQPKLGGSNEIDPGDTVTVGAVLYDRQAHSRGHLPASAADYHWLGPRRDLVGVRAVSVQDGQKNRGSFGCETMKASLEGFLKGRW